jgi:hypothetical protein
MSRKSVQKGVRLMVDVAAGCGIPGPVWELFNPVEPDSPVEATNGKGIRVMFLALKSGKILVSFNFFGTSTQSPLSLALWCRPKQLNQLGEALAAVGKGAKELIREVKR